MNIINFSVVIISAHKFPLLCGSSVLKSKTVFFIMFLFEIICHLNYQFTWRPTWVINRVNLCNYKDLLYHIILYMCFGVSVCVRGYFSDFVIFGSLLNVLCFHVRNLQYKSENRTLAQQFINWYKRYKALNTHLYHIFIVMIK